MIGGTEDMPWGIALVYLFAGLLFLIGLRDLARNGARGTGLRWAATGMALVVATALYSHNAALLVKLSVILFLGGGAGLMIGRRTVPANIPAVLAIFQALVGIAIGMTGVAAYLDPPALGIAEPVTEALLPASRIALVLATGLGVAAGAGSCLLVLKAWGRAPAFGAHPVLPGGVALLILGLGGAFHVHPTTGIFLAILMLSLFLGLLLILSFGRAGGVAALSIPAGCSGWAAAALGWAMQNPAMIVGGALAGAAAMTLAFGLRGRKSGDAAPLSNGRLSP